MHSGCVIDTSHFGYSDSSTLHGCRESANTVVSTPWAFPTGAKLVGIKGKFYNWGGYDCLTQFQFSFQCPTGSYKNLQGTACVDENSCDSFTVPNSVLRVCEYRFAVWQSPWLGTVDTTDIKGNTPDDDFFITSFTISCYTSVCPQGFSLTTAHPNGTTKSFGWYSVSGTAGEVSSVIPVNSNGPTNF